MARSREKITSMMEKFCMACVVISLVLNVTAGVMDGELKMILAACNWVSRARAILEVFILRLFGRSSRRSHDHQPHAPPYVYAIPLVRR